MDHPDRLDELEDGEKPPQGKRVVDTLVIFPCSTLPNSYEFSLTFKALGIVSTDKS